MSKKVKSGLIGQIFMALIPVIAVVFLVAIILAAVGGYMYDVVWMVLSCTIVVALAGLWFGWKNARLPGIGGKVAYLICSAAILVGIMFPPLYWFA